MKMPVKFASSLSEEQINELKEVVKQSPNSRCRPRTQAILLSSENFSIDQISQIYDIGRAAISTGIDHLEPLGIKGLSDLPGPGGPCLLTDSEKQLLLELAAHGATFNCNSSRPTRGPARQTSESLHHYSAPQSRGLCLEKNKKTIKDRRPETGFEAAQAELQELK